MDETHRFSVHLTLVLKSRVLIAPLHWGLGHATRCIPLIHEQIGLGNEVVVAATGGPKEVIQSAFPNIEFIDIPFMTISYPADGNMARHFFWKGPRLIRSIWNEHRLLQKVVVNRKIDLVISDSRFGLWSRKAKSVFVTHQVHIISPVFEGLINALNRWVLNKYDEVWIPDFESRPGLAGKLSHPIKLPEHASYIGPLSRFTGKEPVTERAWENVGIVSGPEPQRSLFEAELARRFIESGKPSLIIQGKPHCDSKKEVGELTVVSHLDTDDFIIALKSADHIYCRSGYSTIMDLHALGLNATFFATPGQTEQEYLAELHAPAQEID